MDRLQLLFQHPENLILLLAGVFAVAVLVKAIRAVDFTNGVICPNCKGTKVSSDFQYKGVISHRCRTCNCTFDTLRSRRR